MFDLLVEEVFFIIHNSDSISCGEPSEEDLKFAESWTFWVEGVATVRIYFLNQCDIFLKLGVGIFGLLGNSLTSFVLLNEELKNTFNRLLVTLVLVDNILITFILLNYSFVRGSHLTHLIQSQLFPIISSFLVAIFLRLQLPLPFPFSCQQHRSLLLYISYLLHRHREVFLIIDYLNFDLCFILTVSGCFWHKVRMRFNKND